MSQTLPKQKLSNRNKTKEWKESTVDHYVRLAYTNTTGNRTTNYKKATNYELFNGRFNKADLEYVCNPLGLSDQEYPATLQHYDITSPAVMLLLGEEIKRPDNTIVLGEGPEVINRKNKALTERIKASLEQLVMSEIDPSTIDPNNPPPTPEEITQYDKYTTTDLIESQANKLLKVLKKRLTTKDIFNKGWKDVLIAGEEIYWVGIVSGEPMLRRCNPLDISVLLSSDSDYIDEAMAVVECRILTIPDILDEFGDDLSDRQISQLEEMVGDSGFAGSSDGDWASHRTDDILNTPLGAGSNFGGFTGSRNSNFANHLEVVRVEWKSMKKVGTYKYTEENGLTQETMVDEEFKLSEEDVLLGNTVDWFWINEAWEGTRIGNEIYINIQPKPNQRKRLDNPYACSLGYSGKIYNATNSVSVSLVDRLKPYQYLYNIISYRLELAFASDMGKIMIMDLAQIPRSEGMDLDRWMYYLKAMKIAFVNSQEEGKKGSRTGMVSTFNQFTTYDLTLSNTIQQYINTLDFIKQQIAYISGISPQRLGSISTSELVGNVERAVQQSSHITEYYFDAHNEVKRRVYTALIESAKIAYREGLAVQYILDDMGIEMLQIDGLEFENSEFAVFMTNQTKDIQVAEQLKSLFQSAIQADKVGLSDIVRTIIYDSPTDMIRHLERAEANKAAQIQQAQESQLQSAEKMHQEQMADKQADRDLMKYKIDTEASTKLQTAEISALGFAQNQDVDADGVPDVMEVAAQSLKEREVSSKAFLEQSKLANDKEKHSKEISLKEKEIKLKSEIENKKIEAIKVQNSSQELIQKRQIALKEKEIKSKEKIARMKPRTPKSK